MAGLVNHLTRQTPHADESDNAGIDTELLVNLFALCLQAPPLPQQT
jgi:hypothetical protein